METRMESKRGHCSRFLSSFEWELAGNIFSSFASSLLNPNILMSTITEVERGLEVRHFQ